MDEITRTLIPEGGFGGGDINPMVEPRAPFE